MDPMTLAMMYGGSPASSGINLNAMYNPLTRIMAGLSPQAQGTGTAASGPLQPGQGSGMKPGAGLAVPGAPKPYAGPGAAPGPGMGSTLGQAGGLISGLKSLSSLWGPASSGGMDFGSTLPLSWEGGTVPGLGGWAGSGALDAGMDFGSTLPAEFGGMSIFDGIGGGAAAAGAADAGLGAGAAAAGSAALAGGAEAAGAAAADTAPEWLPMLFALFA